MAAKYSLNLQLQLQSPQNVGQVVSQLQKQLGGVAVNVQVKNSKQAVQQIQQITKASNQAATAASQIGDAFGVSLKRFAAFSLASRAIGVFTRKLANAVDESIEFDRQLNRIKQVTRASEDSLSALSKEITRLATTFGVASSEITSTALILAQAGLNANDTRVALEALTKTRLSATFGDINETAEGAVALLAQFGEGAGALERQLSAVNKVSAQFAVESEDLIEVIRRSGGVFRASGGSLEELLGLFTSVRATTRENAESIATALKTIFTRIQRPQTIEYLRELGVELVNAEGAFIGPFEAIKRLSSAFGGLEQGSLKFIEIAEQLGGYRQIGKVIPLLQQFAVAEKARQAALAGGQSLTEEAIIAQESLAVQFQKVREQFLSLIRSTTQTGTFKVLVGTFLNLSSSLIKVADSIKPLLPLLTAFAAIKFAGNVSSFFGGLGASLRKRQFGGPIQKFASGGLVPGSGNRDTVPAMLTPGEFVIRKSSVNKLGAGTLAAMNENRFNNGGQAKRIREGVASKREKNVSDFSFTTLGVNKNGKRSERGRLSLEGKDDRIFNDLIKKRTAAEYGAAFLSPENQVRNIQGYLDLDKIAKQKTNQKTNLGKIPIKFYAASLEKEVSESVEDQIFEGVLFGVKNGASLLSNKYLGGAKIKSSDQDLVSILRQSNIDNIIGNVYEAILSTTGAPFSPDKESSDQPKRKANATFDFPNGLGALASTAFGNSALASIKTDAKTRFTTSNIQSLLKKAESDQASLVEPQVQALLDSVLTKPKTNYSREDIAKRIGNTVYSFRNLQQDFPGISKDELAALGFESTTAGGAKWRQKFFGGAIQRFVRGGQAKRKAYVFDFDDTLGETEARVGAEPNNPDKFSQFRGDVAARLIDSGQATKIAGMAKKRAQLGHDIYVLTARPGEPQTVEAINRFMQRIGAPAKGIIGVGNMFAGEREPGKRPGTTRLLTTGSKKAKILEQIAPNYDQTWFLDDAIENLISGKQVAGVKTALADTKAKRTVKRFAKGGAASDTVPALLTPGEFVINRDAAQRIGYGNLDRMNKKGVAGFAKGGPVAVKKFANGGGVSGGGGFDPNKLIALTTAATSAAVVMGQFADSTSESGKRLQLLSQTALTMAVSFGVAVAGAKAAGDRLKKFSEDVKAGNQRRTEIVSKRENDFKAKNAELDNARKQVALLIKDKAASPKTNINAAIKGVALARDRVTTTKAQYAQEVKNLQSKITKNPKDLNQLVASAEAEQKLKKLKSFNPVDRANESLKSAENKLAEVRKRAKDSIQKITIANSELVKATKKAEVAEKLLASARVRTGKGTSIQNFAGNIAGSLSKAAGTIGVFTGAVFAVTQAINSFAQASVDAAKIEEEQAIKNVKSSKDIANVEQKLAERRQAERNLENSSIAGTAASGGAAIGGTIGAIAGGPIGAALGVAAGAAIGYALGPSIAKFFGFQQSDQKFNEETNRQNVDAILQANGKVSQQILKDQQRNFSKDGAASVVRDTEALAESFKKTAEASERAGVTEEQKQQANAQLTETAGAYVQNLINLGVSGDILNSTINTLTASGKISAEELRKVAKAALDQRAAMLAVTKANIDGLKISSVFNAGSLALENFIDQIENGGSNLSSAIRTAQAAQENMGMGDQGIAALETLQSQAMAALGSNASGEVGKALARSFDRAKIATGFADAATKLVAESDFSVDTVKAREKLAEDLSGLIPDNAPEELRKQIGDVINNTVGKAELGQSTEEVVKNTLEALKPFNKAVIDAAQSIENQNQQIKALVEKRKQLENALIDAQKRTIDLQIEGAKILAEAGGAKFTPDQEFAARVRQFNTGAQKSGVALRTGSIEEILAASGALRGKAAATGIGKDDQEKRAEFAKTQEDLINLARQRIEQTREEIDIINKKNAAEKDALDKLLSGDVAGFEKAQRSATAASLLESGYSGSLLGTFSNQDLAGALKNLEERLSPDKLAAVAAPVFAKFGIRDNRAAQVFAGTTPELQAKRQQLAQGGAALSALGLNAEEMARTEIKSADMTISQATIVVKKAQDELAQKVDASANLPQSQDAKNAQRAAANAATFSRGGVVYASRGRLIPFIPRGTDTVPAMLTPGEFVVRREAVQAGNNLQILRSMNNGGGGVLSNGVQGLARGGSVQNITNNNIDVNQFTSAVNKLQEAIQQIPREFFHQFNGTTNMSVTGLAGLTDVMKNIASDAVAQMAPKLRTDATGNTQINNSVLG